MAAPQRVNPASVSSLPTPRPEVRNGVKNLLKSTKAFGALPPDTQQRVARDTAIVADYLAAPEGIPCNAIPGGIGMPPSARALADPPAPPPQASYDDARQAVSDIGQDQFRAGAAREGAEVAGVLLQKVNFVQFVGGLIQGV